MLKLNSAFRKTTTIFCVLAVANLMTHANLRLECDSCNAATANYKLQYILANCSTRR